ncbi:ABC-type transport system involved in multi-copper enzyme maturation permease subunit [Actinoplanes tereljensis]|uniref:ABC transporter permease n=1 Tax=Paractinoplanes tereljensis TaxID=571912 RepID=A0A919TX54_9ACTN|nr:ABC transporter permease [Actinoplanes tereljensis]GIF26763.1 ABC transporter permease [Actinoplanes tereljensis]
MTTASHARPQRDIHRVTGPRVLRSEWSKFWDLRSTWITLGIAMVLLIGFGLLSAARYDPTSDHTGRLGGSVTDAVAAAMGGQQFAQLAIGVLGVLVMAGEYSTGMIRSTLTAVPKRLPVLLAKTTMFFGVVTVASFAAVLVSFLAGHSALADTDIAAGLTDDRILRGLTGAALYFGLVGVIGIGLGGLLRSVAGGIASVVVLLMLLPVLTDLLPSDMSDSISKYLPSNAGASIYALTHDSSTLSPEAGLLVFAAWAAAAVGAAGYRLMRTDA